MSDKDNEIRAAFLERLESIFKKHGACAPRLSLLILDIEYETNQYLTPLIHNKAINSIIKIIEEDTSPSNMPFIRKIAKSTGDRLLKLIKKEKVSV